MQRWQRPYRVLLAGLIVVALLVACSDSHKVAPQASPVLALARGKVSVEGGLLRMNAVHAGVVANVAAKEGNVVHRGQLLAAFDDKAELINVALARAEIARVTAQKQVLVAHLQASRQLAQRLMRAASQGAVDQQKADEARQLELQLVAEIVVVNADMVISQQKLQQSLHELDLQALRAPQDAEILSVSVQEGSSVVPESPLFVLLPARPLIVRAEVNESFISHIQTNMLAVVSVDTDQSPKLIRAHVVRVGNMFGPSSLGDDPSERVGGRIVECILSFEERPELRVGQNVLVRFIQ